MLMSGLRGPERNEFLDRMLPTMLPLPVAQKQTFTALMAEQQVHRQARAEEQLIAEAVRAGKFTTADQLAPYPTLQQKYNSLSAAAKARIIFLPETGAGTAGSRKS
jgi:hypothetical protein